MTKSTPPARNGHCLARVTLKRWEWTISTTSQLMHLPSNTPISDSVLFLPMGSQKVAIHLHSFVFYFFVSFDKISQLPSRASFLAHPLGAFIQLPKACRRVRSLQGKNIELTSLSSNFHHIFKCCTYRSASTHRQGWPRHTYVYVISTRLSCC